MVRSFIERFLEPADWLGELLFGLIMALTLTLGAGLVVAEGPDATKGILEGVVGCLLAWALIDAVIFMMNEVFERSRMAWLIETIQKVTDEERALALIQKELDPVLGNVTAESERARLYQDIFRNVQSAEVPKTKIEKEEIGGAVVTFLVVMSAAVPALVPFLFFKDRHLAMIVSNGLLLGTLFLVGYWWAREARTKPWLTGCIVMLIGGVMVIVAKLLGG
jgi:hypothetical protein